MTLKRFLLSVIVFLGLVVFLSWYLIFGIHLKDVGKILDFKNGVWLEHAWVDQPQRIRAVEDLVADLKVYNMKYAYVHVGPLESDGKIARARYNLAPVFLKRARVANEVRYLAWIGQLRSKIDLENSRVRAEIVNTARFMVENVGFDGVHVDIEPITDEDAAFMELMRELAKVLPEGAILSAAVGKFVPKLIPLFVTLQQYNTRPFFEELDKIVDQIVVMTYETKARSKEVYTWFVEQEIIYLSNIVGRAELLIGIPSYDYTVEEQSKFPDFHPEAENMRSGLNGVVNGIRNIRTDTEHVGGVAVYAYWETDPEEWRIYQEKFENP